MAESNSNCLPDQSCNAKPSVQKKPLHYTKSNPVFHSVQYLGVHEHGLQESRSRSSSAPLTKEALKVAKDLREASDNFLKAKRVLNKEWTTRRRRRTVGSFMLPSIEKEVFQAAFEEAEEISPILGTPV